MPNVLNGVETVQIVEVQIKQSVIASKYVNFTVVDNYKEDKITNFDDIRTA